MTDKKTAENKEEPNRRCCADCGASIPEKNIYKDFCWNCARYYYG